METIQKKADASTAKLIDAKKDVQPEAPKIVTTPQTRLQKLQKEESRMVMGVFRFHECEGGVLQAPMKKYKGPIYKCNLRDGEIAEVPLWVARWINGYDATAQELNGKVNSCGYPIHAHALEGSSNTPKKTVGRIRRRMSFESTEFMAV